MKTNERPGKRSQAYSCFQSIFQQKCEITWPIDEMPKLKCIMVALMFKLECTSSKSHLYAVCSLLSFTKDDYFFLNMFQLFILCQFSGSTCNCIHLKNFESLQYSDTLTNKSPLSSSLCNKNNRSIKCLTQLPKSLLTLFVCNKTRINEE